MIFNGSVRFISLTNYHHLILFRHISEKKKKKKKKRKNQAEVSTRAFPLESPSNSRIPNIAVHFNLLHPIPASLHICFT